MAIFLTTPNIEKLKANKDIAGLIKALKYKKNSTIQIEAAQALGQLKDPRAVGPLIEALKDSYAAVLRRTENALDKLNDPKAVESLVSALKSEYSRLQKHLKLAIARIGVPAVEPLIKALGDYNLSVRVSAAETLGKINDRRVVEPLIEALRDENWEVRLSAARALGELKDTRAVGPLIITLKDHESRVRVGAAWALKEIDEDSTELPEKILSLIAAKDWDKLKKIGEPAVEQLISALKNTDQEVKAGAARALADLEDKRAVEPLVEVFMDIDEKRSLRRETAWALDKIGWKPASQEEQVNYLIATEKWGKLIGIGKPAVKALKSLLKDKHAEVRVNAAKALDKIGWQPSNQEEQVTFYVAAGKWSELIKIGKPAIESLIRSLRDKNSYARLGASMALKKITRRDFADDYHKWLSWWEQHK